ncbi:MAG: FAD/NAD(P)-binding protein [Spirochaetaceae bacterium]
MHDIVFIGAGIHGVFLACNLVARGWTTSERLALIDPWPAPLHLWRRNTAACGMRFLRSTSSHNMTDDFHALRRYARARGYTEDHFLQPYSRPTLELFNRHGEEVITLSGIDRRIVKGRAVTVEPRGGDARALERGWVVRTDNGDVAARRVALAVGRSEEPRIPDWARRLPPRAPVHHVFDTPGSATEGFRDGTVTIVGGGISAVQTALSLADGRRTVNLVSRHPVRVAHFDSDPCYMGPRCLGDFLALPTPAERLHAVGTARTPGTIPWDVAAGLDAARDAGAIRFIQDDVDGATMAGSALRLSLRRGDALATDRVVLATGFEPGPPERTLLAAIARDAGLPLNSEGYPAIDRFLRWSRGFFVASALAELELGPMAPNIYGAHAALRRILPALAGTGANATRLLSPWNPVRSFERRAG